MWHQTACKISVSLTFLNWVKKWNVFFYHISDLMLATLIQRSDENLFIFDPVQKQETNWDFAGCFMIVLIPYILAILSNNIVGPIKVHLTIWGWLGEAKVLTLPGRPRLAYSWARPILAAGKGKVGMFLFLLFLYFHSFSSFSPVSVFHLLYYLLYLLSPFPRERTQNEPQGLTCC